jgi:hypothetical protein
MTHFVRHVNFPPYRCRLILRDDFEKTVDKFTGGVLIAEPTERSDANALGVMWKVCKAGMEAVAEVDMKEIGGRSNVFAQVPKLPAYKRLMEKKQDTGRTWAGMEGLY